MMGIGNGENERPIHQVTISKPFYMSKYEVTQKEYQKVMGTNPSNFRGDDLPVECVSWYDAVNYCNARSKAEGRIPAYIVNGNEVAWNKAANGYRLPTEAEWEYAARGRQSKGHIYAGSNNADAVAWYKSNSRNRTHAVGSKTANDFGLYDMSGNVWEWCWDYWYGDYSNTVQIDPSGAAWGLSRVLRGGSWVNYADNCAVAYRSSNGAPSSRGYNLGFRVVYTQ